MLTMKGKGVGYVQDGAVAVKGNKIIKVGIKDEILAAYQAETLIDAGNKLIMPGLIDAHIHTGLAMFRGVAQDMSHWMQKGLWPFKKHIDVKETKKGSLVNIIEGIKAGTTTFGDYDLHMNELVENYSKIGARAKVAETVNELPNNLGDNPVTDLYTFDPALGQEKYERALKLYHEWHLKDDGRINVMLGPQGPDMLSIELLKEVQNQAEKLDTLIHMHVAQGDRETLQMEKRYQKRSIPFLEELGMLNERLIAVHLTEATEEETIKIAKSGAKMTYCAGSIGIIDGIVTPVQTFIDAGGTACLGSDQAAGNNCNNMFNEMKFAAILNKVKYQDPRIFNATQALRMATIESAKVLGMENEIGSLEDGKKADIILVNLDTPAFFPVLNYPIRNIVPNLVYSANGSEVDLVMIDGKIIMNDREVLTVCEKTALTEAQAAAEKVVKLSTDDILKADSDILKMVKEGLL